ncbi:C40 family peptidase [Clavibacter nebraskensis]|uniref:NlpC/P60 family protein n=1 Tax=Clavibacter nebraskensis TaxID=31963 RepID=A0A399Q3L0_9MICO|nr:NlpC/P60 family protein [Clavibacter nebraskensis]RIJ13506.1 NlpC/P60 family protein [Clavibacter nebraskensis]UQB14213.1 C40 family peptidase [Clavibacter nebraskensis]UQB17045.1 C40 family peptidase [Clavibacter nebraskensis]
MNHLRPTTVVISTIAVGVIAVSSGVAAQTAFAATDYPSWADVQAAKANQADTQAAIDRVTELVTGLQESADQSNKAALIAGEKYAEAQAARDAKADELARLQKKADEAQATALTSRMRAGLLASHLARAGGQDITASLFASDGDDAEELLRSLGTMTKLSESTQSVYQQALADRNSAASLSDQAQVAKDELARLADEAQKALDDANSAAATAQAAVTEQTRNSDQLIAQLALLKDSTSEIEAQYIQGITQPPIPAAVAAPAPSSGGSGGGGSSSGGGGSSSGGGSSAPAPGAQQPSRPAPGPAPAPAPAPAPTPSGNAAQVAISFAKAQLGESYVLGGAGPNVWDCSGLVMMAYRAAGIDVGSHSVSSQYDTMQAQGRLVPFSQRQAGDIIFWNDGSGFYHDAISLGGNTIIAAPKPGDVVKIQGLWGGSDIMPYVGRPG